MNASGPRVLLIDNYDSFTYNLAPCSEDSGPRSPSFATTRSTRAVPRPRPRIVISPGPGRPADAGASVEIVRRVGSRVPTLGVCLGHQAIVEAYGGEVGPPGGSSTARRA